MIIYIDVVSGDEMLSDAYDLCVLLIVRLKIQGANRALLQEDGICSSADSIAGRRLTTSPTRLTAP